MQFFLQESQINYQEAKPLFTHLGYDSENGTSVLHKLGHDNQDLFTYLHKFLKFKDTPSEPIKVTF